MCREAQIAALELSDLFRLFGDKLGPLDETRRKIRRDLTACRTPALGGHSYVCNHCQHRHVAYNSCCNRHCPKCQSLAGARWLEARMADLLPIPYFHAVFTIPHELQLIFLQNKSRAYALLFAAVSETLQEVAGNPKRLGAQIGITAILHTWTQKLLYHPHIHGIVTGGGLVPGTSNWVQAKPKYLLPIKVLSLVFRGKLLQKLELGLKNGSLVLAGSDPKSLLIQASRKNWVVYLKPPLAGPKQVLNYLGRYTHRIAISNHRLISLDGDYVTFAWRDRQDGNRRKLETIPADQFLKRFLLHAMPRGFVRIRHFGLLANSIRRQKLAICRNALSAEPPPPKLPEAWTDLLLRLSGKDPLLCPACKIGQLIDVAVLPAIRPP